MRRLAAAIAAGAALTFPASALAVPPCPGPAPSVATLLADQGRLESVIVDRRGRVFFTNETQLLRLDKPGATPRVLVDGVDGPGGLAFDAAGKLLMGSGNTLSNGAIGDLTGPAGLLRVDPETGAHTVYATGLSMANGVARGPDGAVYATNDLGRNVDRVAGGQTQRGWSHVDSGNGAVVDSSGRWLYVAQTFRPAAIARVDLAHPDQVTTYVAPTDPADLPAGLDGMARDAADDLFVAANGAGEVWKVRSGSAPSICLLLDGLAPFPDGPSAVAVHGADVFVVTFGGDLIRITGVAATKSR